jgi:hypothetical protein
MMIGQKALRTVFARPVARSLDGLKPSDVFRQGVDDLFAGSDRRDVVELADGDNARTADNCNGTKARSTKTRKVVRA